MTKQCQNIRGLNKKCISYVKEFRGRKSRSAVSPCNFFFPPPLALGCFSWYWSSSLYIQVSRNPTQHFYLGLVA